MFIPTALALVLLISFNGCATKSFVRENIGLTEQQLREDLSRLGKELAAANERIAEMEKSEAQKRDALAQKLEESIRLTASEAASERAAITTRLEASIQQTAGDAADARNRLKDTMQSHVEESLKTLQEQESAERARMGEILRTSQQGELRQIRDETTESISKVTAQVLGVINDRTGRLEQQMNAATESSQIAIRAVHAIREAVQAIIKQERDSLLSRANQLDLLARQMDEKVADK